MPTQTLQIVGNEEDLALRLMHQMLRYRRRLVARALDLSIPPSGRSWVRVADMEHADAWLIAWSPGSAVGTHDHGGSYGAVHVLRGMLVEQYSANGDDPPENVRRLTRGMTVRVPPDRVHDVANTTTRPAFSLHVYSPRLTSMSFYPQDDSVEWFA